MTIAIRVAEYKRHAQECREQAKRMQEPEERDTLERLAQIWEKLADVSEHHPELVPSDRVEAAVVYGCDGQKIGTIERLMLEKLSGTVAYAVVKCGGVLQGHIHHYPLPWNSLKYNATRKAYETDVSLEQLRSGPSELDGQAFDWGDRSPIYPQYWTL